MEFVFDAYRIDTDRFELAGEGGRIAVEPQVLEFLIFLIRNRDRMVTREELHRVIWGGRFVSDSALSGLVRDARQAIGDNGRDQRLIETLHGRGFRFRAQVAEVAEPAPQPTPPAPAPGAAAPAIAVLPFDNLSGRPENDLITDGMVEEITAGLARFRWFMVIARNSVFALRGRSADVRRLGAEQGRVWMARSPWPRAAIAALALVLLIAAGGVAAWYMRSRETPPGGLPTIAVLPLTNLSGDPEQEYFSDGITEDMITALTKFPGLRVLGRNTSFAHKGQSIDTRELGRRLGVRYLLEGSVRRAGDRIRVSVQLVDATSAQPIWAERYDRGWSGLFAIQDDVTQRIVGTLSSQVGRAEVQRLLRKPPRSLQAYELTLKGRALWLQSTQESIPEARRLLEQAIAIDSSYAPAYVYAAFTYLTSYNNQWTEEFGQRRTIEQMADKARSAIRLDDAYALAHATYAVALVFLGDHTEARTEAEQAIALNPNDPDVLGRVGQTFVFIGEHKRAIEIVSQAIELDPFTPAQWLNYLSRAHYFLGDDAAAAQAATACIEKARLRPCFETQAAAYGQLGNAAEAEAALAELRVLTPNATATGAVERLRHVFFNQGDLNRLVEGLRKAGLPEQ